MDGALRGNGTVQGIRVAGSCRMSNLIRDETGEFDRSADLEEEKTAGLRRAVRCFDLADHRRSDEPEPLIRG
jgi:hypothetical protein